MTFTTSRTPPLLGDIFSDTTALASLAAAAGSAGGVSAWAKNQIDQLNALPGNVSQITAQSRAIGNTLQSAGIEPTQISAYADIQNDLATINANFPQVQADVGRLSVVLYPAISGGNFNLSTVSQITASGVDLVGTFDAMQNLFAARDDARRKVSAVANDPSLTPQTRTAVAQAIANSAQWNPFSLLGTGLGQTSITTYIVYGLAALLGYKLIKKVL